jgi:hypothetical protein
MTAPKLSDGLEPVAWRVDWPLDLIDSIAPDRFYDASDAHRMNCHLGYVPGVAPVPEAMVLRSDAQAALQALAAEKDAEIAALKEDAARYRWLREEAQYFPSGRAPAVVLCDEHDLLEKGRTQGDWGFISGGKLDAAIDSAIALAAKEAK